MRDLIRTVRLLHAEDRAERNHLARCALRTLSCAMFSARSAVWRVGLRDHLVRSTELLKSLTYAEPR